jgi:hypothetical protein
MTKVEALEEEIKKLSPGEMAQLRDRMSEQEWEEWDKEIERDSESGRPTNCSRKRLQTTRLARALSSNPNGGT